MSFIDNMDQGLGGTLEEQENTYDGTGTPDSGTSPGDDSSSIEDTENTEGGSSESSKPKRQRKKKDAPPTESTEEVPESEGEFEDPYGPFSSAEPGADASEQSWDFSEAESTDADGPAGIVQEDAGEEVDDSDEGENFRPARRRRSSRPAVLDASGNLITQRGDAGQHDLSVLTAARNARRVLTATVDGIEMDGEELPRVIFYLGTVKVMIPFSQMGFDLDPEQVSQREARLLIDSMLSARIDYMVRGVDIDARIAVASRRDAMLMRQRTILNARIRTGNDYRINEGMRVTARIVHVSRYVVRVEVYGFECYVRLDSISNLWVSDIREVIQVGEERLVEIVKLERGEDGRVTTLRVSIRAAEDAPNMELRDGNTYTGRISNFSDTAYFVRVNGIPVEVRCPIKSNHTMEMMDPGDYVKFYVRGIYEGVPTGAILKIIKKKFQPGY